MNNQYLLDNRTEIEEYILKKLNIKWSNTNIKINSSRTIGDYNEIYMQESFKDYLNEKLNIIVSMDDLKESGAKSIEDFQYNNDLLFDAKSCNFEKKGGNSNLISPFVLLKNLDKNIFYIFAKYIKTDNDIVIKEVMIRRHTEFNYKKMTFTGSIGRGQIMFNKEKVIEIFHYESLKQMKNIIVNKAIQANERVIKSKAKQQLELLAMLL